MSRASVADDPITYYVYRQSTATLDGRSPRPELRGGHGDHLDQSYEEGCLV